MTTGGGRLPLQRRHRHLEPAANRARAGRAGLESVGVEHCCAPDSSGTLQHRSRMACVTRLSRLTLVSQKRSLSADFMSDLIVRDLIDQRQAGRNGSLGQALADLRGCLRGSKDLSTRP